MEYIVELGKMYEIEKKTVDWKIKRDRRAQLVDSKSVYCASVDSQISEIDNLISQAEGEGIDTSGSSEDESE